MDYGVLKEVEVIDEYDFIHQIASLSEALLRKNWHRSMSILDDFIPVCIDENYQVFKSMASKHINHQIYREFKHAKRVSYYAKQLAVALSCSCYDTQKIEQSGFVHDLGKLIINHRILYKEDTLSDHEWKIIKKHPQFGSELLSLSMHYQHLIPTVAQHHEWWNGDGYPNGLKGEEILFSARVLSVVDAYDAMTCNRSYQKRIDSDAAVAEIMRCVGSQFDPEIAAIFIEKVVKKEDCSIFKNIQIIGC